MATVKLPFQNPHVTLVKDEILEIHYHHKKFKVAVSDISKIYLSKRKSGYLSAMIGNLFLSRATGFKFSVQLKDNNCVTLDILSTDKFYFVSLITWVRKQITKTVAPAKVIDKQIPSNVNQPVAA